MPTIDVADRHPSTRHLAKFFENGLVPSWMMTGDIDALAAKMIHNLPDSSELTAGLRKLLEAKDCFIRAALEVNPVDYRDR